MKFRSCYLLAAPLLAVGIVLPRAVLAECFYRAGPNDGRPGANAGTKILNAGVVQIAQNAAVGSVVHTLREATWIEVAHCTYPGGNMTYVNRILWGDPVAGMDLVYSTNIPGIGYRVHRRGTSNPLFPGTYTVDYTVPAKWSSNTWVKQWTLTVELVKTAPRVGNGPLDPMPIARVESPVGPSEPYVVLQVGDIRILAPSCRVAVASKNQTVTLGQEFRNRFRGVGTTTASKDFQVAVNCQASPNGIENTVSLTMDAKADASNAPGVLGIDTGSGMAQGVGIQVLDGTGQPVTFGQAKELGQSKDGDYVLPFKARYYQVAADVGNGKANGRATVTLSYK